jgi:hypothetical protein
VLAACLHRTCTNKLSFCQRDHQHLQLTHSIAAACTTSKSASSWKFLNPLMRPLLQSSMILSRSMFLYCSWYRCSDRHNRQHSQRTSNDITPTTLCRIVNSTLITFGNYKRLISRRHSSALRTCPSVEISTVPSATFADRPKSGDIVNSFSLMRKICERCERSRARTCTTHR